MLTIDLLLLIAVRRSGCLPVPRVDWLRRAAASLRSDDGCSQAAPTSGVVTLSGTALSLAALGWVAATDPKRRRAFGLPPHPGPRRTGTAWLLALLPGFVLPVWAGGAGFVIWLGAVTVAGWGLAALPPDRPAAWIEALRRRLPPGRGRTPPGCKGGARPRSGPCSAGAPDVAALEQRIAELEARVAELLAERDRPAAAATERPHPLPH